MASSRCTGNSPNSSMKSTPRWARVTSPGTGTPLPPPRTPATVAVWWGARKGGVGSAPRSSPAAPQASATSSASPSSRGGRMPGRHRASIVLPAPGGPVSKMWCPPAAAISSARLASDWPRSAARSGPRCGGGDGRLGRRPTSTPWSTATASARSATVVTSAPDAQASPVPSASRHRLPVRAATSAAPRPPTTGRMWPSSASSPNATTSTSAARTVPLAARSPRAMGRSYADPPLGRSAGDRFTVIERALSRKPLDDSAAHTR